jgi:hypothetical protein
MTSASSLVPSQHEQPPASLLTLAKYLELALDEGECVVLARQYSEHCAVYVGVPTGSQDDLAGHGVIAAALVTEMLELTEAGANRMTIGDQTYRFNRSFTNIADLGAVVFTPT